MHTYHLDNLKITIHSNLIIFWIITNFCDGIFIGAAFSTCSKSFGWTVAYTSIAHELPQELADFFVLTGIGTLTAPVALALNFISALSPLFGAALFLSMDISDSRVGCVLAYGGGIYLYNVTECIMSVHNHSQTKFDRVLIMLFFIFGATAVGLVLLDHDHCDESDGDGGDGHDH